METIQKRQSRWSREVAAQHVEAWHASGLSQDQYGKSVGVTGKHISRWSLVLSKEADRPNTKAKRKIGGFARVVVASAPEQADSRSTGALEVALGNGRSIIVGDNFDAQTLSRLIAVLDC